MLPLEHLALDLERFDTGLKFAELEPLLRRKLADGVHGKLGVWRSTLSQLPVLDVNNVDLLHAVSVNGNAPDSRDLERLRGLLLSLAPWRKGPFHLFGIDIDAEWRSDLKWQRLHEAAAPLAGRKILDVGSGNGYYALRAAGQGAAFVLGIDPTLNHLSQYLAVQRYLKQPAVHVLPLRLNEMPRQFTHFDTTLSMGVLYHQREPEDHLAELQQTLRPGGELILETLILPGDDAYCETPPDRYARMRNVWKLPTTAKLLAWLERAGFRDARVADVSVTTTSEQRTTEWMPFESLDKALHPEFPELTVEGLPRPRRALIVAARP